MLLEDALLDMIQWLKRRDLDAAQLASRILDSRITAKAAVLALHSVRRITVDDDLGVSFALADGTEVMTTLAHFGAMLSTAYVQELDLQNARCTCALFAAILPHIRRLRECSFIAPTRYASEALANIAFGMVFFFREIHISTLYIDGTPPRVFAGPLPWFAMPSVRQCEVFVARWSALRLQDSDSTVLSEHRHILQLVSWLNSNGLKKRLTLHNVYMPWYTDLRQYLKHTFEESTIPAHFELTLTFVLSKLEDDADDGWIPLAQTVNDLTGEELVQDETEDYVEKRLRRRRLTFHRRSIADNQ